MKARNILALGAAVGLAALAIGCKSDSKRELGDDCRESITEDMISVCRENVPVDAENTQIDLGSYRFVQLIWSPGQLATLSLATEYDGTVITAETMFGENVLGYRSNGSYSFRVNDNPFSVRIMNLKENTWKYVCRQLDCESLLERHQKLRAEQQ